MHMNFEVFVLGTSGMMHFLVVSLLRNGAEEGELFLFDCGEGTQISLKMLISDGKKISSIFISICMPTT